MELEIKCQADKFRRVNQKKQTEMTSTKDNYNVHVEIKGRENENRDLLELEARCVQLSNEIEANNKEIARLKSSKTK